ncbi:MAG: phosphotransferase family protein [Lachnospiraceae bacterium]|nr:phosphotransferase family protein [Lachnospiraceae bacterium]
MLTDIRKVDGGMTNDSYSFLHQGKKYLLRLPGKGSEYLVNRWQEKEVYEALKGKNITDELYYFDAVSGVKISVFIEGVHNCDVKNAEEVARCMRHLRKFHNLRLQVNHGFDIYERIAAYKKHCRGLERMIPDYEHVYKNMMRLKRKLMESPKEHCLCHVDPVADNFLIKEKQVYLVDWEYAAMSDPHMDIAMFCIYSELKKADADRTIDAYFAENVCVEVIRRKIYAYMALGAFLWVLWATIRIGVGDRFEGYRSTQLALAREFYGYAVEGCEK